MSAVQPPCDAASSSSGAAGGLRFRLRVGMGASIECRPGQKNRAPICGPGDWFSGLSKMAMKALVYHTKSPAPGDGMATRKNLQSFSGLWRFEQGHGSLVARPRSGPNNNLLKIHI